MADHPQTPTAPLQPTPVDNSGETSGTSAGFPVDKPLENTVTDTGITAGVNAGFPVDRDGGNDQELLKTEELGGPRGPEPTRFGDWERNGRCSDF